MSKPIPAARPAPMRAAKTPQRARFQILRFEINGREHGAARLPRKFQGRAGGESKSGAFKHFRFLFYQIARCPATRRFSLRPTSAPNRKIRGYRR